MDIWLLPALSAGLFWAVLLLQNLKELFGRRYVQTATCVALLCALMSYSALNSVFGPDKFGFAKAFAYSQYWLVGPFIFLVSRSILGHKMSWTMAWHLVPWLAAVAILYCALDWSQDKIQYAHHIAAAEQVFVFGFVVSLVAYIFYSWQMLYSYRQGLSQQVADPELYDLQWLNNFLRFMVWLAIYILLIEPIGEQVGVSIKLLDAVLESSSAIFAVYLLLLPPLASQMIQSHNYAQESEAQCIDSLAEISDDEQAVLYALGMELKQLLTQRALYLQTGLTLKQLASCAGCSHQQASLALNKGLNINFYQLVNQLRIEYAQQALINQSEKSVTTIALESGFSTKSTFYNAFRKQLNCTPSEYRRQNLTSGAKQS